MTPRNQTAIGAKAALARNAESAIITISTPLSIDLR